MSEKGYFVRFVNKCPENRLCLWKNMFDMGKNAFFQYHLEDIKKYDGVEIIECPGAILLHLNLADGVVDGELKDPCRINAFMAIVCTRGEVTFSANMTEYRLCANTLFVSPATIFEFHESHDCELYVLAFDGNFVGGRNLDIQLLAPVMPSLQKSVELAVGEQQIGRLKQAFGNFYAEFAERQVTPYTNLIVSHMLCALIYRICETLPANGRKLPENTGVKDRSAEYFERLMKLLAENFRTERNVEFYADKMNLTPKHLSRVIRNFTGKSVHSWIDNIVVMEMKNLLRYSNMSIQQISFELNFPNPSFMGQYFKRITGKTPGQFRREK